MIIIFKIHVLQLLCNTKLGLADLFQCLNKESSTSQSVTLFCSKQIGTNVLFQCHHLMISISYICTQPADYINNYLETGRELEHTAWQLGRRSPFSLLYTTIYNNSPSHRLPTTHTVPKNIHARFIIKKKN